MMSWYTAWSGYFGSEYCAVYRGPRHERKKAAFRERFSFIYKEVAVRLVNRFAVLLLLWIVALLATSCTPGGNGVPSDEGGISLVEAGKVVLEEIVDPETLDHDVIVFAWFTPLQRGDLLYAFRPESTDQPVFIQEISKGSWFFWIDDAPGDDFAHPTRFVLVDQASGEAIAYPEEWWPVLNGESLWSDPDVYWDQANWVYTNME